MKSMKKILAVALALVMLTALGVTAFAAGEGSITIKNATKGQEYAAYKVFDATVSGSGENVKISYKTASTNASKLNTDIFDVSAADSEDNVTISVKEGVTETEVLDWVKANYDQFGGTKITGAWDDTNSTYTFSNLEYGYYYITSSLGTAVTIDSTTPTAEVYDKNVVTPVAPTKTIVSVDGTAQQEVTSANAHVGSVVGFKLEGSTANWTGKEDQAVITEEWTITDTPTRMTIDKSSVVVKFNGTALAADAYTVSVADSGAMTITVPMVDEDGNSIYEATVANKGLIPIEVTYSATITSDAGKNPAKNEIPGGGTEVFTYAFQVAKTDGTDPLKGAQFELWSKAGGDTDAALKFIDNGDGTYIYDPDKGTVTTLDMTTNTTISILGLDNLWSYTLKEITVPEGYNQVADITVAGSSLTKVTEGMDTSITSTALYKETVVNKAGTELPSTGGIGTTLFYVIGSALFLGAAVVLVTRRRVRE